MYLRSTRRRCKRFQDYCWSESTRRLRAAPRKRPAKCSCVRLEPIDCRGRIQRHASTSPPTLKPYPHFLQVAEQSRPPSSTIYHWLKPTRHCSNEKRRCLRLHTYSTKKIATEWPHRGDQLAFTDTCVQYSPLLDDHTSLYILLATADEDSVIDCPPIIHNDST